MQLPLSDFLHKEKGPHPHLDAQQAGRFIGAATETFCPDTAPDGN
jgi:hypothetical protein